MKTETYLVAGCRPWNRRVFNEVISHYPGRWHFIGDKEQLDLTSVRQLSPRYIFFLHWSWKVPEEIVRDYECVCFHMTDVPYGRGGSPLQNLIIRGHRQTKLTALRMDEGLDTGPVYMKADLPIGSGSAEEIYTQATYKSAEMIKRIISEEPLPVPQEGEATTFRRRRPEESQIPDLDGLPQLYDFIRMLDAEEYPGAFLEWQGFRFELSKAVLEDGRIIASTIITELKRGER